MGAETPHLCSRCGAPLAVGAPGSIVRCPYCGAEAREPPVPRAAPVTPGASEEGRAVDVTPADDTPLARLCARYVDSVTAYVRKQPTSHGDPPDEPLRRSIEDKLDILDGSRDDFRHTVVDLVQALAVQGKRFLPSSNERMRRAFEARLKDGDA